MWVHTIRYLNAVIFTKTSIRIIRRNITEVDIIMRMRLFICLFVFVLSLGIISGCAGLADYEADLPGGYSIVRTSAHSVFIAPKTGEGNWGSNVNPTKVTEVLWDEKYILAKQLGLKDDPKSSNGYQIPEKQSVHYWILEYETGETTGPLNEEGFIEKRIEFQIADDVILKDVDDMDKY